MMADEGDASSAMPAVSQKVFEYEHFVNEVLRKDLQKVLENREGLFTQVAQYLQLKTVIEKIKDNVSDSDLKTQVDLGCNFYVQAKVPDASKIFVNVGFGFFVEFTHQEALTFIEEKVNQLNKTCDQLTKDSAKIKANIKLVYEALKELQHITDRKDAERTVVF
ncbi:protein UXT-like isoform X1 [Antedon mediterranea]|uniref:protein UXT-like isoform X1 n=1 Tax=Antedon mediterranea TaxID=105859 RepID=UPI003AF67C61